MSHAISTAPASASDLANSMEEHLTTGPFGDGITISGTAEAFYRGAARVSARSCGFAPETALASDNPQVESVRRAAVDEAFRHLAGGRAEEAREVFGQYLALRERITADPLVMGDRRDAENGVPLLSATGSGDWLGDLLISRFNATTTIGGAPIDTRSAAATADIDHSRVQAIALARRSVPQLADDVLRAVSGIFLYRAEQPYSGYTTAAPLFVFAAEQMFRDSRVAAELLIHECLHQKLNDIGMARALFRDGYHDDRSATIEVPWSYGSSRTRHFSADRSFAAFHVYAHQTVLYLGMFASAEGPEEAEYALENLVLSWARAAHFARELSQGPILDEIGRDGHRLVRWLTQAVDGLGTFGLPDGSRLSAHPDAYASP